MFGLFKKKKYRQEILPIVAGEAHGIKVTFRNYPIRIVEGEPDHRVEFYPDFNSRLIRAIWNEIKDFDDFMRRATVGFVSFSVVVKDAPTFILEFQLHSNKSKREFTAEMPDAVINAFEREKIGR